MIIGIDPGLKKTGVCLYDEAKDKVVELYTSGYAIASLMEHLEDIKNKRNVSVVIESFEPQPWKTNGRLPRGSKAMFELVDTLRYLAQEVHNRRTYLQSPSEVARELRDDDIKKYLLAHKEVERKANKHERDALKHALYCASKLKMYGLVKK